MERTHIIQLINVAQAGIPPRLCEGGFYSLETCQKACDTLNKFSANWHAEPYAVTPEEN